MCAMTQFVIVVPVPNETTSTLAEYYMQYVLLKLGVCHLVILDDGSPFKGLFLTICKPLNVNYDILAKRDHKSLLVKKIHRLLNKAITIAAEDRGTNDIFVAASVVVGYAWNSSPIAGTGILRSVPAIGRELRFPLDIDSSALLSLVSNNAEYVASYLRLTDSNRHFATTILKILIEDRRTAHAERVNDSRNIFMMHPGDIVMARAAVQSGKRKDKVAKLRYTVRGPFRIIKSTGRGSYIVQKLNKHDSLELEFTSEELYIVPPSLKPSEPVDSSNIRYLNQSHIPIINPLKKTLNIELF